MAQTVKHLSTVRETWVQSLGWEDPLEKEKGIFLLNSYLNVVKQVDTEIILLQLNLRFKNHFCFSLQNLKEYTL